MRYLFYTQLWKRPDITRVCFLGLKRLISEVGGQVLAVYSEDEKSLCKEFGFECMWSKNTPLGRKHNNGLIKALDMEWDYLVNVGSDDLINPKLFDLYEDLPAQGLLNVHLLDSRSGKMGIFSNSYPLGAGRMIRREVIEDTTYLWTIKMKNTVSGPDYRIGKGVTTRFRNMAKSLVDSGLAEFISEERVPPRLWANDQNSALDHSSDVILLTNGVRQKGYDNKEVLVVDIKSDTNIWGFDNYDESEFELDFISKEERDALRRIRQTSND